MSDSLKILASMRSRHDEEARQARLGALSLLGADLSAFLESPIQAEDVSSNIEGFIGCTAVPTGVVGPLLYRTGQGATEKVESVFALAATSEGALIASMTRGAYVLSQSGGFKAHVIHQKMMRAPAFRFSSLQEAVVFESWLKARVPELTAYVKQFSKHAELLEIRSLIVGSMVECKFSYSSGDAAGQNMTTTCTWHACLKIEEDFNREHTFRIQKFILDCNGSSDKKVSYYQIGSGRGVHVTCEAVIPEAVLKKTLKVTAKEFLDWGLWGKHLSSFDGSVGHNVNVANSIAALFLATGQDVACVHESSTGFMHAEDRDGDLYVCLNLPRLVIGTVGGGTSLPHFNQALKLMGCDGAGKIERFASLIAGFALGLELSTFSAMVNGEFAMAHERMGRNRPKDRLTKEQWLSHQTGFQFESSLDDNTSVWKREGVEQRVVLSFKPSDTDVLNTLYKLTGSVSPLLLKEFCRIQGSTEFVGVSRRERKIYSALSSAGFKHMPVVFMQSDDSDHDFNMMGTEYVSQERLVPHMDPSEFMPKDRFSQVFEALSQAQKILTQQEVQVHGDLGVSHSSQLYLEFSKLFLEHGGSLPLEEGRRGLIERAILRSSENLTQESSVSRVVVHNNLKPSKILFTKDRGALILGWQWAGFDYPQRDVLELIAYLGAPQGTLKELILSHKSIYEKVTGTNHSDSNWFRASRVALDSLILSKYVFVLIRSAVPEFRAHASVWTKHLIELEAVLKE